MFYIIKSGFVRLTSNNSVFKSSLQNQTDYETSLELDGLDQTRFKESSFFARILNVRLTTPRFRVPILEVSRTFKPVELERVNL